LPHLHNVYHQLTLSVVDELHARGVPIVQTIHDYKIACPAYTLFTQGAPCRRCVDGSVLNAVRHRCIKGSAAASALAAAEAALADRRRTYDRIDVYIAPSRFAAGVAAAAGVPEARIRTIPYLLPDEELLVDTGTDEREPVFFFGGRLEETKGVRQLLAAFSEVRAPARLRIAGWGALEREVAAAAAADPRIEFLGGRPRAEVLAELAAARALVLPSVWEDNCPLVMLEAQARATPVIVSDRGGPPEFVRDAVHGFVVDPNDACAFAARLTALAQDAGLAAELGRRGRARVVAGHGADAHYERLLAAYREARVQTWTKVQ
jgi:glycosyltransferase involved in cell wall biosynthesis